MTKRKKIEREQNHFFRDYASVIKAVIVLLILVGLLVGVILFKPVKKEEIKDPSILKTNEKNLNNNDAKCDGPNAINLKEDADKITISYEIVDDYLFGYMAENDEDINGNGVIDTEPVVENRGYALKLKLNNLSDKLFVIITNDLDDNTKLFYSNSVDEDGLITWFEGETKFIRTYTVQVYSNTEGCKDELYREFTTSLPRYNLLSRSFDCTVEPAKDLEICDTFLWTDKTYAEDAREFQRVMREYVKKQAEEEKRKEKENNGETENDSWINKIIKLVKDNYIIAAVAGVVLVIIIIIIIKRVKKHEK